MSFLIYIFFIVNSKCLNRQFHYVNFDLEWLATRNQPACQKRKQEKKYKEHDKSLLKLYLTMA